MVIVHEGETSDRRLFFEQNARTSHGALLMQHKGQKKAWGGTVTL